MLDTGADTCGNRPKMIHSAAMQIETRPIADLLPYPNNAKMHSDEQITKIAASIKEFGFNNPVLIDQDGGIIAGHGRIEAARKLNMQDAPTITLAHLSEAQKKAYILADNRLAEVGSEWDLDLVSIELEQIAELDLDINMTGFDFSFIDHPEFDPATEEEQGSLGELQPKYIECPHCKTVFDSNDET